MPCTNESRLSSLQRLSAPAEGMAHGDLMCSTCCRVGLGNTLKPRESSFCQDAGGRRRIEPCGCLDHFFMPWMPAPAKFRVLQCIYAIQAMTGRFSRRHLATFKACGGSTKPRECAHHEGCRRALAAHCSWENYRRCVAEFVAPSV